MEDSMAPRKLGVLRGVERVRYYRSLLRHTLKPHGLNTDHTAIPTVTGAWQVSPELKSYWDRLFGEHCEQSIVMYPIKPVYDAVIELCGQMKINFINIMHFACDIEFCCSPDQSWLSEPIHMRHSVSDVMHYNHNRVIVVMETVMENVANEPLVIQKELLFVKNVPKDLMGQLASLRSFREAEEYGCLTSTPKAARLNDRNARCLERRYLAKSLGREYGYASGDLNPLHTRPRIARLTGHRDAFAQGGFIGNLALKRLTGEFGQSLATYQVRMVSPVYFEQEVALWLGNNHLEVQDAQGKLLAIANFELR